MKHPDIFIFYGRLKLLMPALAVSFFFVVSLKSATAITMDEAVTSALANNLDLRAARFEVEKARGRLIQAGLWPNPSLEFSGRTDRAFNNEGERTMTVGFVQAFPITGRLRFSKEVSRVDVAQSIVEIRNRERLLIGDVERGFLTVLLIRQQIVANRQFMDVNRDFVTLSEQRLKKAEVSEVDVNLAQIELQRLESETAMLEADLSTRELSLKQRLGLAPSVQLKLEGDVQALAAKFRPENYMAATVVNRPDLSLLELTVDRARAEIRLARAEAWQDWSISLDYENERTSDEPVGLRTDRFTGLRVSIPLALWNNNQGRIHEQKATVDQARQQISALRLSIQTEIATAKSQATRLRDVVEKYQTAILPKLASSTDLLKKGYSEGLADATRVLQAQQQGATLRTSFSTVYISYVQALIDLETATGSSRFLQKDFLIVRKSQAANSSNHPK